MSSIISRWYLPFVVVVLVLLAIGFLPVSLPLVDNTSTSGAPNGPIDYSTLVAATNDTAPRPIGPIRNGTVVTQDFPSAGMKIASLSLFLATSPRASQGAMKVTLQTQENGQWTQIATQTIDTARLRDKAFSTLSFAPPLAVARGQMVRIVLEADAGADNAVSWYANPLWDEPAFPLFVNRDRQEGAGIIRVSYGRKTGYAFQMLGLIWDRVTIFLDPLWRVTLVLGVVMLIGGVAFTVRVFAA
jgi:hypothetical protein